MRAKAIMVVYLIFLAGLSLAESVSDELLDALTAKENSQKNVHAVGDLNRYHHAYGLLQIRQPYLDDVVKIVGKKAMLTTWGKAILTLNDMKDPVKARWAACRYLTHYGKVYKSRTGLEPTEEVYARIHNGGPFGWKALATKDYWADVKRELRAIRYQVAMNTINKTTDMLDNWCLEMTAID